MTSNSDLQGDGVKLTKAQRQMLRFLEFKLGPLTEPKPGQVAMLRTMEERGLVSRGSIRNLCPRWSLTAAGRALLTSSKDTGNG